LSGSSPGSSASDGWFRRLVVRYEYHAENFQGFVHLAAVIILLRHL